MRGHTDLPHSQKQLIPGPVTVFSSLKHSPLENKEEVGVHKAKKLPRFTRHTKPFPKVTNVVAGGRGLLEETACALDSELWGCCFPCPCRDGLFCNAVVSKLFMLLKIAYHPCNPSKLTDFRLRRNCVFGMSLAPYPW